MSTKTAAALPEWVNNLFDEAQEVPLGPNDARELLAFITAQAQRIRELEAELARRDVQDAMPRGLATAIMNIRQGQ